MRCRFPVYCMFSFYAVIVYAFVAHWVWAEDGWLRQLGVHDFAGSGAVSLLGAMNALIGISMLGPRLGRFDESRLVGPAVPINDFKPSSPATILFGLFMLWWGWIGALTRCFNCGSSFGITGEKWLVATRAGGGLSALLYTTVGSRGAVVIPHEIANGMLGSGFASGALVAITATCASVHAHDALIIGFVGSVAALAANQLILGKVEGRSILSLQLRILRWELDDPVGAVGVHGASAIWGLVAVGLFADAKLPGIEVEDGLFRGGSARLLGVQLLLALSIMGWSLVTMPPFFYLLGIAFSRKCCNPRAGLRVDPEDELVGLDHVMHSAAPKSRKTTMCSDVEDTGGTRGTTSVNFSSMRSSSYLEVLEDTQKTRHTTQKSTVCSTTDLEDPQEPPATKQKSKQRSSSDLDAEITTDSTCSQKLGL
eukprot:Skav216815  [mRNA]  locus=scaffold135:139057:144474:- [translate_table: standard]